jgi:hypothetical protein
MRSFVAASASILRTFGKLDHRQFGHCVRRRANEIIVIGLPGCELPILGGPFA